MHAEVDVPRLSFSLILLIFGISAHANLSTPQSITLINLGKTTAFISSSEKMNPSIVLDLAETTNGSCIKKALSFQHNHIFKKNNITQIGFIFEADISQIPTHVSAPRILIRLGNNKSFTLSKQLAPGDCDIPATFDELLNEHHENYYPGLPQVKSEDPEVRIRRALGITM